MSTALSFYLLVSQQHLHKPAGYGHHSPRTDRNARCQNVMS